MQLPTAVLAIADASLRKQLGQTLTNLRWRVLEANGGAEALSQLEQNTSAAVIMDTWFPDLDVQEFAREVQASFPEVDLVSVDGSQPVVGRARSARHGELMHALRLSQDWDGAAYLAPSSTESRKGAIARLLPGGLRTFAALQVPRPQPVSKAAEDQTGAPHAVAAKGVSISTASETIETPLPELIGNHPSMLEVSRRIRLVANMNTSVLIQGASGTGKELVAKALHRLSGRSAKPFVVLNCAAIPESLLEAELFGHTRGAFTGAVQNRAGRIEAASGGTLFLDEIGEMPLALQAKLLRFLEAGEIQRVGDNEPVMVDVRVIAATHQPLAARSREGLFRQDVFYRLAVFLIKTPLLRERADDIPMLVEFLVKKLGEKMPAKRITEEAMGLLVSHDWPGNVRELSHVIERAYILAGSKTHIEASEIEFEQAG